MCKERPCLSLFALCLLGLLLIPSVSQGTTAKATIEGNLIPPTTGDPPEELNLSGIYTDSAGKQYKIEALPNSSNNARVSVIDSSPDKVILRNMKITALDAGVTGHIEFWGEDFDNSVQDQDGKVYVDAVTSMSVKRKFGPSIRGAVGSEVHVSGAYVFPPTGTWQHVHPTVKTPLPPPPTTNWYYNKTVGYSPVVWDGGWQDNPVMGSNTRRYKGIFNFLLTDKDDWIEIAEGGGITVTGKSTGGSSANVEVGEFWEEHDYWGEFCIQCPEGS
ncbi:hypothetical protein [Candidatus Nitronereus thalassa]|uniref:Uncharacterized protein n=1 Tax=Candidatus Nitronereus thalassa TaxID=3020898 RepID=A0ABU3K9L9_9BACT|nr:hypothetical protein [Candidatus Nitronereus thalassa]MDT7043029.1 hypothetical protein [Candidatus Nitronereus thalassa]